MVSKKFFEFVHEQIIAISQPRKQLTNCNVWSESLTFVTVPNELPSQAFSPKRSSIISPCDVLADVLKQSNHSPSKKEKSVLRNCPSRRCFLGAASVKFVWWNRTRLWGRSMFQRQASIIEPALFPLPRFELRVATAEQKVRLMINDWETFMILLRWMLS